ncbi:DNA transposition protein [Fulvimarina endophytica]|uniref:DNA transposition protein n=1 Tax=Fulvimarina endophytica TaxID=2293836 RepID=A0A371X328_9HYPH|nr:AAA family ATPase [Fulvimarina endophytica]RFC63628.1 DNA transposition protein [Fulvimarina endophytica]
MSEILATSRNGTGTSPGMPAPGSWTQPDFSIQPEEGAGRSAEDYADWRELGPRVIEVAEAQGWTKAETARRIGMPEGTFHQWLFGRYAGRYDGMNTKVRTFLSSIEEMEELTASIPSSPPFVKLRISMEIMDLLAAAQAMKTLVLVSAEAGMGKTVASKQYAAVRSNVFIATMSEDTRTAPAMLSEIAETLDVHQPNMRQIVRSIGKKLARTENTLLVIDEAQNLGDSAINQLRHFVDVYGVGVAIMANSEVYDRFGKNWMNNRHMGQLSSRIFKRMRKTTPTIPDIEAFLGAWKITEKDQVRFLTGVGKKPGALRQIDMTIRLAKMMALGSGREITLADLKAAWTNRDVEGA